jgi:metallophosphoesterase superfamily enzyme
MPKEEKYNKTQCQTDALEALRDAIKNEHGFVLLVHKGDSVKEIGHLISEVDELGMLASRLSQNGLYRMLKGTPDPDILKRISEIISEITKE